MEQKPKSLLVSLTRYRGSPVAGCSTVAMPRRAASAAGLYTSQPGRGAGAALGKKAKRNSIFWGKATILRRMWIMSDVGSCSNPSVSVRQSLQVTSTPPGALGVAAMRSSLRTDAMGTLK